MVEHLTRWLLTGLLVSVTVVLFSAVLTYAGIVAAAGAVVASSCVGGLVITVVVVTLRDRQLRRAVRQEVEGDTVELQRRGEWP